MTVVHTLESAKWVADILNVHGFDAYIVGGAVRDMYLGRSPKDFDVATNATPHQLMELSEFARSRYKDTAQAYGVTRIRFTQGDQQVEMEVATFRRDVDAHKGRKQTKVTYAELEEDVLRRDFTINALAFDPRTEQIIDYVGGLEDLDAGVVRFIGDPGVRIREDPLRVLRAIRFKNQLGFTYDAATAAAIHQAVAQGVIERIAIDRVRSELTRMFIHSSRRQAMEDLAEFDIMGRILPEVMAGRGVPQPYEFHAEGDVWQHELLIMDYLPARPSSRLAWAALLHDIGKVPTYTPATPGDRIRFNRHYAVGAEMAKTMLRRLRFSNRETSDIYWMIYHHMAVDDIVQMRPSHRRRMFEHPAFGDLLALHRADAAASWRPGEPHDAPDFTEIDALWRDYQAHRTEHGQPSLKGDLGIDGHWLRRKFGHDTRLSGPMMRMILQDLNDWYHDEGVTDELAYEQRVVRLLDGKVS